MSVSFCFGWWRGCKFIVVFVVWVFFIYVLVYYVCVVNVILAIGFVGCIAGFFY